MKIYSILTISTLLLTMVSCNAQPNKNADEDPITTVNIGGQEWMKVDIKTLFYNNGEPISEAKTPEQWEKNQINNEGCYRRLNNGTVVYNGFALRDIRGIVPDGFRVPTYDDFKKLFKFLGGRESATKSMATYPLDSAEVLGDQETGMPMTFEIKPNGKSKFDAKEGGFVYDHGALGSEGDCSYWWTSTEEEGGVIVVDIGYCSQDLGGGKGIFPLAYGFALRAIKK